MASSTPPTRAAKFWQFALAAYWLMLLTATHVPRRVAAPPGGYVDDSIHFVAYAILAGLLALAWQSSAGELSAAHLRWAWVAIAIFAGIDELTQPLVGRTASWADWFADLLGAAIGLFAFSIGMRLRRIAQ